MRAKKKVKKKGAGRWKCPVEDCDEVFETLAERHQHAEDHGDDKPFRCTVKNCGKAFRLAQFLKNHLKYHSEERLFQCTIENCNKAFKTKTDLYHHKVVHRKVATFICTHPGCGKAYKCYRAMSKHCNYAHGTGTFTCSHEGCDKTFKAKVDLKRHKERHTKEKDIVCPHEGCGKRFKFKNEAFLHAGTHSTLKPFKCAVPNCEKAFRTALLLSRHRVVHTTVRAYPCTYAGCNLMFKAPRDVRSHYKHVHSFTEKTHVCPEPGCGKAYKKSQGLLSHMSLHTGEMPYVCDRPGCDRKFRIKQSYMYHLTTHAPTTHYCEEPGCTKSFQLIVSLKRHVQSKHRNLERVHECPEPGCGKLFKFKSDVKSHLRSHSGVKTRYPCTVEGCGRLYSCTVQLRKHIDFVHNDIIPERKFQCDTCGSAFTSRAYLKAHQISHSDQFTFSCPRLDCRKRFKRRSLLKKHMQTHKTKKDLLCPEPGCNKYFLTTDGLNHHKSLHKNKSAIFTCVQCDKAFPRANYLAMHQRQVHIMTAKHKCPDKTCRQRFKSRPECRRHHRRMHTTDGYTKCDVAGCDKVSKTRKDVLLHKMRIHLILMPGLNLTAEEKERFELKLKHNRQLLGLLDQPADTAEVPTIKKDQRTDRDRQTEENPPDKPVTSPQPISPHKEHTTHRKIRHHTKHRGDKNRHKHKHNSAKSRNPEKIHLHPNDEDAMTHPENVDGVLMSEQRDSSQPESSGTNRTNKRLLKTTEVQTTGCWTPVNPPLCTLPLKKTPKEKVVKSKGGHKEPKKTYKKIHCEQPDQRSKNVGTQTSTMYFSVSKSGRMRMRYDRTETSKHDKKKHKENREERVMQESATEHSSKYPENKINAIDKHNKSIKSRVDITTQSGIHDEINNISVSVEALCKNDKPTGSPVTFQHNAYNNNNEKNNDEHRTSNKNTSREKGVTSFDTTMIKEYLLNGAIEVRNLCRETVTSSPDHSQDNTTYIVESSTDPQHRDHAAIDTAPEGQHIHCVHKDGDKDGSMVGYDDDQPHLQVEIGSLVDDVEAETYIHESPGYGLDLVDKRWKLFINRRKSREQLNAKRKAHMDEKIDCEPLAFGDREDTEVVSQIKSSNTGNVRYAHVETDVEGLEPVAMVAAPNTDNDVLDPPKNKLGSVADDNCSQQEIRDVCENITSNINSDTEVVQNNVSKTVRYTTREHTLSTIAVDDGKSLPRTADEHEQLVQLQECQQPTGKTTNQRTAKDYSPPEKIPRIDEVLTRIKQSCGTSFSFSAAPEKLNNTERCDSIVNSMPLPVVLGNSDVRTVATDDSTAAPGLQESPGLTTVDIAGTCNIKVKVVLRDIMKEPITRDVTWMSSTQSFGEVHITGTEDSVSENSKKSEMSQVAEHEPVEPQPVPSSSPDCTIHVVENDREETLELRKAKSLSLTQSPPNPEKIADPSSNKSCARQEVPHINEAPLDARKANDPSSINLHDTEKTNGLPSQDPLCDREEHTCTDHPLPNTSNPNRTLVNASISKKMSNVKIVLNDIAYYGHIRYQLETNKAVVLDHVEADPRTAREHRSPSRFHRHSSESIEPTSEPGSQISGSMLQPGSATATPGTSVQITEEDRQVLGRNHQPSMEVDTMATDSSVMSECENQPLAQDLNSNVLTSVAPSTNASLHKILGTVREIPAGSSLPQAALAGTGVVSDDVLKREPCENPAETSGNSENVQTSTMSVENCAFAQRRYFSAGILSVKNGDREVVLSSADEENSPGNSVRKDQWDRPLLNTEDEGRAIQSVLTSRSRQVTLPVVHNQIFVKLQRIDGMFPQLRENSQINVQVMEHVNEPHLPQCSCGTMSRDRCPLCGMVSHPATETTEYEIISTESLHQFEKSIPSMKKNMKDKRQGKDVDTSSLGVSSSSDIPTEAHTKKSKTRKRKAHTTVQQPEAKKASRKQKEDLRKSLFHPTDVSVNLTRLESRDRLRSMSDDDVQYFGEERVPLVDTWLHVDTKQSSGPKISTVTCPLHGTKGAVLAKRSMEDVAMDTKEAGDVTVASGIIHSSNCTKNNSVTGKRSGSTDPIVNTSREDNQHESKDHVNTDCLGHGTEPNTENSCLVHGSLNTNHMVSSKAGLSEEDADTPCVKVDVSGAASGPSPCQCPHATTASSSGEIERGSTADSKTVPVCACLMMPENLLTGDRKGPGHGRDPDIPNTANGSRVTYVKAEPVDNIQVHLRASDRARRVPRGEQAGRRDVGGVKMEGSCPCPRRIKAAPSLASTRGYTDGDDTKGRQVAELPVKNDPHLGLCGCRDSADTDVQTL